MTKIIKIPTHTASTLTDYLNCIKEISCNDPIDDKNIYRCFRGQANKRWQIKPSLFRKGVENEYKMLTEARRILRQDLDGYNSLEQLAFLQHYGLPTRLLDVTQNPLVALYFACLPAPDNKDADGAVYIACMNKTPNAQAEDVSEVLFKNENIEKLLISLPNDSEDFKKWKDLLTKNHFILPPINNERLERQSGAFVLTQILQYLIPYKKYQLYVFGITEVFKNRIVIPYSDKIRILEDLRDCGIHEGFLFPDVEHKIKYITQTVLHK